MKQSFKCLKTWKIETDWHVGLMTGSLTVTNDGTELPSSVFYDYRAQVIGIFTRDLSGAQSVSMMSYDYTGRPLQVTTRNRWLKTVTTTAYYPHSTLADSTTVEIDGSRMLIARNQYDNLGRVVSITRGGMAGSVNYTYNLHNAVTSINSPGIEMNIFYQDGPATPRWNGFVSATTWKADDSYRTRGYKYTYNDLGWLTDAIYGENETLTTDVNHYNERVLRYSANGAIRRLQRHGLKDDCVYGKIDNLNITLDGNRIVKVEDDAEPLYSPAATDFVDGADYPVEYTYNGAGALVSDADRGISLIEYDNMGWPRRVSFNAGHSIEYVYSIDGQRLRAIHNTAAEGVTVPVGMSADEVGAHIVRRDTTDYTGAVKWGAQGRAMRVEFPGGYAGFSDQSRPVFHFYTADHVGNNRVVVGADGTIEQIQHYYPFGTPIAGIGTNPDHQPYKHGGKELDRHYGLDWHDFAARQYHGPIAGWHNPDRLADQYPQLSPYVYCANNPLSFIDPTGNRVLLYATILPSILAHGHGLIASVLKCATHTFIYVDKGGEFNEGNYFAYGSESDEKLLDYFVCQLKQQSYNDDMDAIKSDIQKNSLGVSSSVKNCIVVSPPQGMSDQDFDDAVINVAKSFSEGTMVYNIYPTEQYEGNCNSSTYTILRNAGKTVEELKNIGDEIPGFKWGWGYLKAWMENQMHMPKEVLMDAIRRKESFVNSIP